MHSLVRLVKMLCKDGSGVTALEYGLIAGIMALALTSSVHTVGTSIKAIFTSLSSATW